MTGADRQLYADIHRIAESLEKLVKLCEKAIQDKPNKQVKGPGTKERKEP